jgi:M3 family oligoendopeptidase
MPPLMSDLAFPTPTRDSLAASAAAIHALLDRHDPAARAEALAAWEQLRRTWESWSSMVHLRFSQNTQDAEARAARDYADALDPEVTELDVAFQRRLLDDPDQAGLVALVGDHAPALWRADLESFDPEIKPDLEAESQLSARYTELIAGAHIAIDGATVNLAGLAPYAESLDRDTRHRAEQARWAFFAANGAALDDIYDQLVKLRHGMARKLGEANFIAVAYRRMQRTDYDAADVARYRDQVAEHVVPLVGRLLEARRAEFGWDRLRYWDEALIDPRGNPTPQGDHDHLVAQAQIMFDRLHPRLAECYRLMREGGYLDLKNRPGKAGGGFCTSFPTHGMPFIFANFNGTHQDVAVFTHEMGHAFQNWASRDKKMMDYLWPTSEAAEINSMGLEFLTYPQIGLLVGEASAERFRRMHLIGSLAFLPYGVCVDHFQHEVYAHPEASPAERHAIWQKLERRYMPWTDYGDLAYPAMGGRWQAKQHIYNSPFYYIDYTLALCCAMQFWVQARRDPAGALDAYVTLCARGGEAPFQDLVRSAGLVSPFAPGALADVVAAAEAMLAT